MQNDWYLPNTHSFSSDTHLPSHLQPSTSSHVPLPHSSPIAVNPDILIPHSNSVWPAPENVDGGGQEDVASEVHPANVDTGRVNLPHSGHSQDNKGKLKRKAEDMERRSGKPLIDAYSRRSATLIEKCKELESLTGAYVMIFTARPESVEDGRYRFYASENFPSEADSLARISKAAKEMKSAVVEFADRSPSGPRRCRKPRTNNGSEIVNGREESVSTVGRDTLQPEPSARQMQAHSTHPPPIPSSLTENGSSEERPPGRFLDFVKNPRPSNRMRNPIARPTISAVPPDDDKTPTSHKSYIAELPMNKDSMVGFVQNLLLDNSLSSLTIIRDIILSDRGVEAAHDAGAIPRLLNILDSASMAVQEAGVVSTSVLILSRMVEDKCSRDEMANKAAITSLYGVPEHSLSEEALVALLQTLSKCFGEYARSHGNTWASDTALPRPMPFLIRLLSAASTGVRLAAVDAIKGITFPSWRNGWESIWQFANPLLPICLLAADCRNLAELESVLSAICAVVRVMAGTKLSHLLNDGGTMDGIDRHLVQPLLNCLGNENTEVQMGALLALRSLHECPEDCDHDCSFLDKRFRATITSHLIPYLSTDDDVDYVVFVRTILRWIDFDDNIQRPDVKNIVQRLLRLLPHGQSYVVENAALSIKYLGNYYWSPFVKMVVLGEAQRFISLLSSPNLDIVRVVLETIDTFLHDEDYVNFFVLQGLIPAIVPYALIDLPTTLFPALRVIWTLLLCQDRRELATHATMAANVIPHLVGLIPPCPLDKGFEELVYILKHLSGTGDGLDALERAGFAELLISRICCIGDDVASDLELGLLIEALFRTSTKLRREFEENVLAQDSSCPAWLENLYAEL